MRRYMLAVPLGLNTERSFVLDGTEVKGFPGPTDFPTHVRLDVDDEHDRFEIAFGYVGWNDEPTEVRQMKTGATVVVGKQSGRVFSIAADMPDDLRELAKRLRRPLEKMRTEASQLEPRARPVRKVFHYEALRDLVPFVLEQERHAVAY